MEEEITKVENTAVEEPVKETKTETKKTETKKVEIKKEVKQEASLDLKVEEKKPEVKKPEVKKEEVKKPEAKPTAEAPKEVAFAIGTLKLVEDLVIYKAPSIDSAARKFSGNIQIESNDGEFIAVSYMKSGFGLVSGYARKEDLVR